MVRLAQHKFMAQTKAPTVPETAAGLRHETTTPRRSRPPAGDRARPLRREIAISGGHSLLHFGRVHQRVYGRYRFGDDPRHGLRM
mmetsp:Transcript_38623/g.87738  ORF Transcript_38623/g.87738 Transcript_38623/m.87738 type:complete len:85 (+) Transcript_38623:413-667(+)